VTKQPVPQVVLALALIVACLAGRFGVDMLHLARKGEHRDFAAVYTAANVYRLGSDFYDPQLVREKGINQNQVLIDTAKRLGTLHAHEGFRHIHEFSYPPFTVLLFVPFASLPFRQAAILWQLMSLSCLAVAIWCLYRSIPLSSHTLLVLISIALLFEPLENSLDLGQINLLILALTCIFLMALRTGHPVTAGVAIGLAAALRIHPALFLLYLAWQHEWRGFAWGTCTVAACSLLAIQVAGWDATVEYVTQIAPKYAVPLAGLTNHSLAAWILNTGSGLVPLVHEGQWQLLGRMISLGLLVAAFVILRPADRILAQRVVPESAFLSVILLLVTPNTTINHMVFTLIPLAVLLEQALGAAPQTRLVIGIGTAALLIGAINDYYAHPLLLGRPSVLMGGIKTYGLMILAWLSFNLIRHHSDPAVS